MVDSDQGERTKIMHLIISWCSRYRESSSEKDEYEPRQREAVNRINVSLNFFLLKKRIGEDRLAPA